MQRKMIEQTVINLACSAGLNGTEYEIFDNLTALSDEDLVNVLNTILKNI